MLVVGLVAALLPLMMCLLPHSRYVQFQHVASSNVNYLRLKWVYERIHFDATPIDIAFIGSSRTQSAVDTEIVEAGLRSRGLPAHVVNFAIPHLGRDLNYLVVRELLENRTVSHLVVELQEGEARAPHPAFSLLGEAGDLLRAPLVLNPDFLDNLAQLPERELSLFMRSQLPQLFGLGTTRDMQLYEGAHWNDTYLAHGMAEPRTKILSEASLATLSSRMQQVHEGKQALGRKLTAPVFRHRPLYRYNLLYLEKLLQLARDKGVTVEFVYLPFFHGPASVADSALIAPWGRVLDPAPHLMEAGLWQNVDHLNVHGARRVSAWLGEHLDLR